MPFWRTSRGWEALPESRQRQSGPLGGPLEVGIPSQMAGMGQNALAEDRQGLGSPSGGSGSVGKPTWSSWRGQEASRRAGWGWDPLSEV